MTDLSAPSPPRVRIPVAHDAPRRRASTPKFELALRRGRRVADVVLAIRRSGLTFDQFVVFQALLERSTSRFLANAKTNCVPARVADIPEFALAPVKVGVIARATGLSRETVRRRLNELADLGVAVPAEEARMGWRPVSNPGADRFFKKVYECVGDSLRVRGAT